MKEIEKDMIFYKLNTLAKKCFELYSEEYLFGIYTLDKGETGIAIVIPTFEEICINTPRLYEKPLSNLTAIDIRYLYKATKEGIPYLIEGLYTDFYIINPRYEHLYDKLLRGHRDQIKAGIEKGAPAEELRIALMKIMHFALNDNSNTVRFIKQLTDAEKLGINEIVKEIGDEGILSLHKVSSATGLSRKTISNLIMKMNLHEIAEVQYLGAKGTYIRFIDDTLLDPYGLKF